MFNFPFIQKIPPFFRNKYVITLLLFTIWLMFFDESNLINRMGNSRKLKQLEEQRQHYIEAIDSDQKRLEELQGDKDAIEKFAREQYHMKKKKEEIFIIEEED